MGAVVTALSQLGIVVVGEPAEEQAEAPSPETEPETEPETTAPETEPETTKPVEPPKSPQTGDGFMFAIIIASIALVACSAVVVYRKRLAE